jgi:hypothetical protein
MTNFDFSPDIRRYVDGFETNIGTGTKSNAVTQGNYWKVSSLGGKLHYPRKKYMNRNCKMIHSEEAWY